MNMRLSNRFSLVVLLSVIAFSLGVFNLIADMAIFARMEHSWRRIDLYGYLLSGPLLVLPLILVGFSRRAAWLILVVGVFLFAVPMSIITVVNGQDAASWSAAILTFVLGLTTLLVLFNSKVLEEVEKRPSQHPPAPTPPTRQPDVGGK